VVEGTSFASINLDDFVSDVDDADADMVWTFAGNTELTVAITNRVAFVTTPNADWAGTETITFSSRNARYVRVLCRRTYDDRSQGYRISELRVFND
jgi:hypothetical protein